MTKSLSFLDRRRFLVTGYCSAEAEQSELKAELSCQHCFHVQLNVSVGDAD
jgi:hypothetical protein